jgi:hypothetical protein
VRSFNRETAVEREKAVQAIEGHRAWKNCVVTFWVMSQLFYFLGGSRGCADFRDPTAVFRFKLAANRNSSVGARKFENQVLRQAAGAQMASCQGPGLNGSSKLRIELGKF